MTSVPNVDKVFSKREDFLAYLDGLTFNLWRPRFVVVHHTGAPNRKQYDAYATRKPPISDAQWLNNLARFYAEERAFQHAPHFFITPSHFCVLSPPNVRGTHAASFNSVSWGVETVGDFDTEPFDGIIRQQLIDALAVMHVAAGIQLEPYERGVRGLHFHRDDPKTNKTCPGKNVQKAPLIAAVHARMLEMVPGDHPSDPIQEPAKLEPHVGTVNVADLNMRGAASGVAPVVSKLGKGAQITIIGDAMNGPTKWLHIRLASGDQGFVAARYVDVAK